MITFKKKVNLPATGVNESPLEERDLVELKTEVRRIVRVAVFLIVLVSVGSLLFAVFGKQNWSFLHKLAIGSFTASFPVILWGIISLSRTWRDSKKGMKFSVITRVSYLKELGGLAQIKFECIPDEDNVIPESEIALLKSAKQIRIEFTPISLCLLAIYVDGNEIKLN